MSGWTAQQITDQSGKTVIVTGANIGLGFYTAQHLAQAGAHVIMACRNLEKAKAAADKIGRGVEIRQLDVADLDSVRQFAAGIQSDVPQLDLLINNAGVMACPYGTSAQGFELQWATNHLGHFALTGLLLPQLEAAKAARVVALASLAHHSGRFRWDDLNRHKSYRAWMVYCQSKLANLVFARELDRRLKGKGSSAVALAAHPGVSNTNLSLAGPGLAQNPIGAGLVKVAGFFLQSAQAGAWPTLQAATDDSVQGGEYFGPQGLREFSGPSGPAKVNRRACDPQDAQRLWDASEDMSGVRYLS
ncbi:MAG: oxidoreductase [Oceanococcus sp.]